jgi:hypothetical protein
MPKTRGVIVLTTKKSGITVLTTKINGTNSKKK